MLDFSYQELVSRNYFFIPHTLQDKISQTTLVFVGCGLSSVMAEMAVRIGFEKFVLVDADKVELSNLNRQSFDCSYIGELKVNALEKKLQLINPNVDIKTFPKGIRNSDDIARVVDSGEIIINTIDCGQLYFDLVEMGMKQKKFLVCPFNPGFGGLVVCFDKNSGTLFDLLKTEKVEEGLDFSVKLIKNNKQILLPNHIRNNLDKFFQEIQNYGYEPQITIGVNMSSSLGVSSITKYLNNETIPMCPQVIFRGLYDTSN